MLMLTPSRRSWLPLLLDCKQWTLYSPNKMMYSARFTDRGFALDAASMPPGVPFS
jgi:hypothetical protein